MKALDWVKTTFKPLLMRKMRDFYKKEIQVETDRILIGNDTRGGEFFITTKNFARLFKDEIEGNDTDADRAAAIKARKVTRQFRDEQDVLNTVEEEIGFRPFIEKCEEQGLL